MLLLASACYHWACGKISNIGYDQKFKEMVTEIITCLFDKITKQAHAAAGKL